MSEPEKNAEESVMDLNKTFCPCCMQAVTAEIEKPTEKQKEAFLMSMLGGTQYSRTFELMEGHISIQVSDRTPEEAALLALVLEALMDINKRHPQTALQAFPISGMCSLISMIKHIQVEAAGTVKNFDNSNSVEKLRELVAPLLNHPEDPSKRTPEDVAKVYADMNSYLDSTVTIPRVLLNNCVSQFTRLRDNLIGACYGADFYKGAGL